MEGWGINLLWRDIVRPAILVGKYRLYPRIPMPLGMGSMSSTRSIYQTLVPLFNINNFFISSSGSIHSQVCTIVSTLPFISLAIYLKLVSPDTGKLNLLISNTIELFPCDF